MLAHALGTAPVLGTETTRARTGWATCMLAHRPYIAPMRETETTRARTGWATWMLAYPFAPMLDT